MLFVLKLGQVFIVSQVAEDNLQEVSAGGMRVRAMPFIDLVCPPRLFADCPLCRQPVSQETARSQRAGG
jgi:hypothetical protein